jgi:alkylation response protein AidB-like acyl-CoA dehydrogenase
MDFDLTAEQQELASMVRSLLAKRSDGPAVRKAIELDGGFDVELWSVLCAQVGAAALAIPDEHGGGGFSLFETHVVLEQLGAALTPSPLLGSGVLAAQALLLSGDKSQCSELLPEIAAGTTIASLVWDWSLVSQPVTVDGSLLTGTCERVLDGDIADVLLVVTADGLFRVDPGRSGVRRTHVRSMDQTLRFATVDLDGVEAASIGGGVEWLPTLRDIACTAVSALQVGAMQRCLDLTVAYSRQREQFGRPIGSFQALKHRMADMFVDLETSRSVSWAAAWSAAQSVDGLAARADEHLAERAALAKAWCSDALSRISGEAVQMHGGIAITWEHDIQLYFKRAHALSQLFGQPREHRARLREAWLA